MAEWTSTLIGVLGTLGGGVIGGGSTYIVTRMQLQSGRAQADAQVAFQQREARIGRVVESRKPYLLPLREAVSRMAGFEDQQVLAIGEFVMARSNNDPAAVTAAAERMRPDWDAARRSYRSLQTPRGENVDSTLDQLIDAATSTQAQQAPERARLHGRLMSLTDFNDPAVLEITRRYDVLVGEVRKSLIAVNKRIEELMAGDTAT